MLRRERRLDEMEVLVEAMPGADADARMTLAAALRNRIKNLIGVTATVTIADPGGVERIQGKARR